MFRGIGDGAEQHAYVFHKAFIYLEAGLMGIAGTSLYTVKTMGLLFAALGLWLLLRYFKGKREAQWLAVLLYTGCGAIVSAAFIGRPEPLTMSAGLASFIVLCAARGRNGRLALAGFLAGLAGLAHLHGLIFLMAGGLWLLWQRSRLANMLAFGSFGALTLALYPLDALLNYQLPLLLRQFNGAAVTQSNQHFGAKLAVLLNYQAIYFHSEGEAMLTILLLLVILLTWRHRPPRLTGSQQYLLLLVLCFWVLCARATSYYFVLLVPFFIIVLVELIFTSKGWLAGWRLTLIRILLVAYPLGAGIRVLHIWRERATQPWPAAESAKLARYMPHRGSRAVVPLDFFFNEIGHYRLRSLTSYAMRNRTQHHDTLSVHGFFRLAAQDSAEYVVTDHRSTNDVYHVPETAPAHIGDYKRVFQDKWHSVYRRVAH